MKKPRVYAPRHRRESAGRTFNPHQSWDNLYDRDWEQYRLKYLKINSRCYNCGAPASVVDHLIPHQGDEKLFKKTDNHIPLCSPCHNRITSLFDRRHRRGNPVDRKIKWMATNRARAELTTRVKVLPEYP